ncbi:MAG: hypothetical protein Q7S87_09215 [Agitococcus sp.]|nr:hypothetical protein [Agitococcus sp.]
MKRPQWKIVSVIPTEEQQHAGMAELPLDAMRYTNAVYQAMVAEFCLSPWPGIATRLHEATADVTVPLKVRELLGEIAELLAPSSLPTPSESSPVLTEPLADTQPSATGPRFPFPFFSPTLTVDNHTLLLFDGVSTLAKTTLLQQFQENPHVRVQRVTPREPDEVLLPEKVAWSSLDVVVIDEISQWEQSSLKAAVAQLERAAYENRKQIILVMQNKSELDRNGIVFQHEPAFLRLTMMPPTKGGDCTLVFYSGARRVPLPWLVDGNPRVCPLAIACRLVR